MLDKNPVVVVGAARMPMDVYQTGAITVERQQ
jgi:hypothetical protein